MSVTPRRVAFLRLLTWRPWRALGVAYWYATRRRVRARHRLRDAVAAAPFAYDILVRERERQPASSASAPGGVSCWPERPTFSILAVASDERSSRWIADAICSATEQSYDRWELLLVGPARMPSAHADDPRIRVVPPGPGTWRSMLARAVHAARGDLLIPLEPGVTLSSAALFRFAEAVREAPGALVLYGDEDTVHAYGRRADPWLKPAWNAELILALDYASHACAVKAAAARQAVGADAAAGASAYALLLAITQAACAPIVHVPHVLTHVAARTGRDGQQRRVAAVASRVASEGATAEAGAFGTVTVRWPMPDPPPSVTILVPTRDRVDLVRTCVESVLAGTQYPNYAMVIIDNGSVEAETKSYFATIGRDPRVSVLSCPLPYNFSAINNFAVDRCFGDYLCFLNNDTEVIDGDWLGEMMRYAVRREVGAVGAQLLYADRSIQHAGVVMGLGNAAGHAHRGLPSGERGYFAQAHAAHHASAVTAACMVVNRRKFLSVGGFDAEQLQIAYNDVDLCLKLGRAGWRNVYAPQARLLHLESRSRGSDLSPAHIERYMRELSVLQERWSTTTVVDPMHHPALDRGSETYRIALQ